MLRCDKEAVLLRGSDKEERGSDKEERQLYYRPVAPSDYLKMHPWCDGAAEEIADAIRGGTKTGTMWPISAAHAKRVREGITAWLGGAVNRPTAAIRLGG